MTVTATTPAAPPAPAQGPATLGAPRRCGSPGRPPVYCPGMTVPAPTPAAPPAPAQVHETLGRSMLVDGFDMVLDLGASRGSTPVDARHGPAYLAPPPAFAP